jgi:hypothetical protein
MTFRRRRSRAAKATDMLVASLKLKAAAKAARDARKAATRTAAYRAAQRTPAVKRLPIVAGAGLAAFAASRLLRGGQGGGPAPA